MNRYMTVPLWLLIATGSSFGQSNGDKSEFVKNLDNFVFLAAGKINYAIVKEGDYDLGFFYDIGDTQFVNFHTCPDGKPIKKLAREKIEVVVGVDCKSLPGKSPDPFSHMQASNWSYDFNREGYFVEEQGLATKAFIPCRDLPAGMLVAAENQTSKGLEVIGPDATKLAEAANALNASNQIIENRQATNADCEEAANFWTVPVAPNNTGSWLAVTHIKPFSLDGS